MSEGWNITLTYRHPGVPCRVFHPGLAHEDWLAEKAKATVGRRERWDMKSCPTCRKNKATCPVCAKVY